MLTCLFCMFNYIKLDCEVEITYDMLGDSSAELSRMSIEAESTIREHCDSLRREVDIDREIAIENIHKAFNIYEREYLSSRRTAKESTELIVEDVSKRTRAFLSEQQEHLQSAEVASDAELALHLDEANKLAQELNDRQKELNESLFDNIQLFTFSAFLDHFGNDASLGELTFTHIQVPFKKLDIAAITTKFKPIDLTDNGFLLPLEDGQHTIVFKTYAFLSMSCIDRYDRQLDICS